MWSQSAFGNNPLFSCPIDSQQDSSDDCFSDTDEHTQPHQRPSPGYGEMLNSQITSEQMKEGQLDHHFREFRAVWDQSHVLDSPDTKIIMGNAFLKDLTDPPPLLKAKSIQNPEVA